MVRITARLDPNRGTQALTGTEDHTTLSGPQRREQFDKRLVPVDLNRELRRTAHLLLLHPEASPKSNLHRLKAGQIKMHVHGTWLLSRGYRERDGHRCQICKATGKPTLGMREVNPQCKVEQTLERVNCSSLPVSRETNSVVPSYRKEHGLRVQHHCLDLHPLKAHRRDGHRYFYLPERTAAMLQRVTPDIRQDLGMRRLEDKPDIHQVLVILRPDSPRIRQGLVQRR